MGMSVQPTAVSGYESDKDYTLPAPKTPKPVQTTTEKTTGAAKAIGKVVSVTILSGYESDS